MRKPDFPRQIHGGEDGTDVYGHKRAEHRYLQDGLLDDLEAKPAKVQRHAGEGFAVLTKRCQRKARQPQTGVFDERLYNELWRVAAYDARATNAVIQYNMAHPKLELCFAFPSNVVARICQDIHPTGGKPGNYAYDYCAAIGSPIVAVEDAEIIRLSGSPLSADTPDPYGVAGYSTTYVGKTGYEWFFTHQGARAPGLYVGQKVEVGEPIGFLGDQKYRIDHIHGGVSSPLGPADARRRLRAMNRAPRVTL